MISLFSILFSQMSLVLKHKLPTKTNPYNSNKSKTRLAAEQSLSPETHTVGGLEILLLFYCALDKRKKLKKETYKKDDYHL
jgi:hypothetical protein